MLIGEILKKPDCLRIRFMKLKTQNLKVGLGVAGCWLLVSGFWFLVVGWELPRGMRDEG